MARAPGVYFEESALRTQITADTAAMAAFVGQATRGRTDKALLCQSWADFVREYGGFSSSVMDLAMAAWIYFGSGAGRARFLRIVGVGAGGASNAAGIFQKDGATVALAAYASNEGAWGNDLAVTTQRYQKQAVGVVSLLDAAGDDLPNTNDNAASLSTGRLVLPDLVNVQIGDVFDVFNPNTGALVPNGPIMVAGIDAASSSILFVVNALDNGFLAGCPANAILRTTSMHNGRARVTAQVANGATSVQLSSAEGFKRGSLVSFHLFSHCKQGAAAVRGLALKAEGVIQRIVGTTVYFEDALVTPLGGTIPASTNAYLAFAEVGTGELRFAAAVAGTGGNDVSVSVVAGAANAVSVSGRHITITTLDYSTETASIAVNAHAEASELVTASFSGVAEAITAHAEDYLTGGAVLLAATQEFYLSLEEEGTQVEEYKNLSVINTSADYIRTRLGGTTSPLVPADANPSRRIILAGDDGAVGTGPQEYLQLPLAASSLALAGGADGGALLDTHLEGAAEPRSGIHLLSEFDDIDFAAAPGYSSGTFQRAAMAYVGDTTTGRQDMDWILDAPEAATSMGAVLAHRQQTIGEDSSYAQLFAPWGRTIDPRPDQPRGVAISVPPSPMIMAEMAKAMRGGAHKSVGNRAPTKWIGVTANMKPTEHGDLNAAGVSIIRLVAGRLLIYGDRTLLSAEDARQSGNVRRWLNYVKQGIRASLGFALFQPADTRAMADIKRALEVFLLQEHRAGALYPQDQPALAFSVKCDSETTTAEDIAARRIVCAVAVSPAPAVEEIRFKINISAGGIRTDEA